MSAGTSFNSKEVCLSVTFFEGRGFAPRLGKSIPGTTIKAYTDLTGEQVLEDPHPPTWFEVVLILLLSVHRSSKATEAGTALLVTAGMVVLSCFSALPAMVHTLNVPFSQSLP